MSGHEHENEHTLEDEERRPDGASDAGEDHDQDADPSLNAPGDADPSGVVADTADDGDEKQG
jgi:hypothetical protein